MAVTFLEPGTDATQDFSLYGSAIGQGTTGTVSSATDQAHTGTRSVKIASGATSGGGNVSTPTGVLADAGTRVSFWFRADAIASTFTMFHVTGTVDDEFALRFSASSKLDINNAQGTTLATGSIALSLNTWVRVTVVWVVTSTTVFTIKTFINGVLDATATNSGTLPSVGSKSVDFQMSSNAAANTNYWYDDLYVDNSNALTDPGNILVTAKRPNANGTVNGFTTQIGAGGSGYGSGHSPQVNEQPLSQTNGWSMIGAGSAITEEYTIENAATGDVDLTGKAIVDFMGWVFAKSALSETGSIVVAGVSSNIALTSTAAAFSKVAGSTTYPSTATAIGLITATTLTTVSLYECGIVVAYQATLAGEDEYRLAPFVPFPDFNVTVFA